MNRLCAVTSIHDIPESIRNTPVGNYDRAELLVGMCMDFRKKLNIPENFAYIIRTGGANLQNSEFKVSYAFAVGEISYLTIIGHDNCGMVDLQARKQQFIDGLVSFAGCEREWAEKHFDRFAPRFEIGNEVDFLLREVIRLRLLYPKVTIVPLFYRIENNQLMLINECDKGVKI
jgi:carbonic anhydrase